MFQNDLSYNVDTGLKMYADDHQIYETGKEINTVLSAVKLSATIATNWYDSNYLQGNLKKYQTMNIRNQCTKIEKTCITVTNKSIAETESLMLLGITVDCKLNFNEHISNQENMGGGGQRGTLRALAVICHKSQKLFLVSRSLFSEKSARITTSI